MATITAAATVARLALSQFSSFTPSSLDTRFLTPTTAARSLRRLTTRAAQEDSIHTSIVGHVGHGKTTLHSALSMALAAFGKSYETKGYPHHTLVDNDVKNMISGDVDMAGAILVVCCAEGPTRLTEEHIRLAKVGGVPQMVVFLNKQDQLVDGGDDDGKLLALELEMRELLSSYEFPGDDIPIVAGSALHALEALKKDEAKKIKRGENEWVDKIYKLMDEIDNYIPIPCFVEQEEKKLDSPFLMPVMDAFSITGGGGGATVKAIGRIERGTIRSDDIVDLVGWSDTRRDIVVASVTNEFGDELWYQEGHGWAGDDVELLLSGVQKNDIHWGMVLAKPRTITLQRTFTAMVYMLRPEEGGMPSNYIFHNKKLLLYMATSEENIEYEDPVMECLNSARHMIRPAVAAKVNSIMNCASKYPSVKPGQHAKMELELITPIACFQGMRFDIQDRWLKDVGVGLILDFIE